MPAALLGTSSLSQPSSPFTSSPNPPGGATSQDSARMSSGTQFLIMAVSPQLNLSNSRGLDFRQDSTVSRSHLANASMRPGPSDSSRGQDVPLPPPKHTRTSHLHSLSSLSHHFFPEGHSRPPPPSRRGFSASLARTHSALAGEPYGLFLKGRGYRWDSSSVFSHKLLSAKPTP
jgi:hypothetical protein